MNRGRPRKFDEAEALQAAMHVFWTKGYEAASCDELLAAMGINCGSMYSTFGDKRALYDRAFEQYCNTSATRMSEVLNGPGTPLENVRRFVLCWSDTDCKGCMISNTLIEFGTESTGVGLLARRVIDNLRSTLEEKLAAAKESGELSESAKPSELAAFLVNTAQGLSVSARAGLGKEMIHGIVNTTLTMLR